MDDSRSAPQPTSHDALAVGLLDCRCSDGCCYGICCPLCAVAHARTNLDGSSFLFNLVCMSPIIIRWLVRSAYGVPGNDLDDCLVSCCCLPCSASQLYQTTKAWGNPTMDAGRTANRNEWERSACTCTEFGLCIYSFVCMPCGIGTALSRSVGMPFWMGCCCANICAARNVIRYQNRIRGSDIIDEMAIPVCLLAVAGLISAIFPCAFCLCCPVLVDETLRLQRQSSKNPTFAGRYLESQTVSNALAQQMAPMSAALNRVAPMPIPAVPLNPAVSGGFPQSQVMAYGTQPMGPPSQSPVGMVVQAQPLPLGSPKQGWGLAGAPVYFTTGPPRSAYQPGNLDTGAPPSYADAMLDGPNQAVMRGEGIVLTHAEPIPTYSPGSLQQYPMARPLG